MDGSFPVLRCLLEFADSCPVSRWCYLKISSSALPSIFPNIRVFASALALRSRWPKYWSFSFSISPSSQYSGLISFRIDWFDLLAVQRTLKSSPAPQFKSINSSALSPSYSHVSHGVLFRAQHRHSGATAGQALVGWDRIGHKQSSVCISRG